MNNYTPERAKNHPLSDTVLFKSFEFVVWEYNGRYRLVIDAIDRVAASNCLDGLLRYGYNIEPYKAFLVYVLEA